VPHASGYLINRNSCIYSELPCGGTVVLPFEGYARILYDLVLQPSEPLLGVAAHSVAGNGRNQGQG